ncbi:MAG: hypothetical protein ACREX3_23980 [Gammaproteobacteria bacterium]
MITKRLKRVPPGPLCRIGNLGYEDRNREPCLGVGEGGATRREVVGTLNLEVGAAADRNPRRGPVELDIAAA